MKKLDALLDLIVKSIDGDDEQCECSGPEMYKDTACLGTPAEIAGLINAGYGSLLIPVNVRAGYCNRQGEIMDKAVLTMAQMGHTEDGCAMYRDGKCLLMESGLTPVMGAINLLTGGEKEELIKKAMIPGIILEWADGKNESAIRFCLNSLSENIRIRRNHTN